MNKNIKIAKELVKLAKSLISKQNIASQEGEYKKYYYNVTSNNFIYEDEFIRGWLETYEFCSNITVRYFGKFELLMQIVSDVPLTKDKVRTIANKCKSRF